MRGLSGGGRVPVHRHGEQGIDFRHLEEDCLRDSRPVPSESDIPPLWPALRAGDFRGTPVHHSGGGADQIVLAYGRGTEDRDGLTESKKDCLASSSERPGNLLFS